MLSTPALLSFVSTWKASALAIAQLGVGAFVVAGLVVPALGPAAPWAVLGVALLSALIRAVDSESWALLIPGGLIGRLQRAFGPRALPLGAAAVLLERLLLAALAAVVIGDYAAGVLAPFVGKELEWVVPGGGDVAVLVAVTTIAVAWLRARMGRHSAPQVAATRIWIGTGIVVLAALWMLAAVTWGATVGGARLPAVAFTQWASVKGALTLLVGIALALPAIGGGDALSRAAHDFQPPRLQALRQVALGVTLFIVCVSVANTSAFVQVIAPEEWSMWADIPLSGAVQHVAGPTWLRILFGLAIPVASVLILSPAVAVALADAESLLRRISLQGALPIDLSRLHRRFGTPTRTIDITVAAAVAIAIASSGRSAWAAHAYGVVIAALLTMKIAALVKLRRTFPATPFRVAGNVRVRQREIPLGLLAAGITIAILGTSVVLSGDPPSVLAAIAVGVLTLTIGVTTRRRALEESEAEDVETPPLAISSLEGISVKPGGVLVPVRNPHALDHVAAAVKAAGDRDVVVMTVRIMESDASDASVTLETPTQYERQLFTAVVETVERLGRPVRMLIVPARNVVDAIAATILRLHSSDVYVGESSTLSAEGQARMLGAAWEQSAGLESIHARLVIVHRSGRTDAYHLGAHPPSLTPADFDLIHRVWLDAVKAVGPHVHHHDIVRAALTQMEQQLNGPARDAALTAIREIARPAEELAAVLRAHDFARFRDTMRNRAASDVGELLGALAVEDQVVAFRILPRKDAAAVFEYLSQDAKEALLKAMAQEDVAALLNNMAPDDRTMFLEELPAAATRQLLALLTPNERSVAVALLGYPERSVGRLMTPHYVAVREQWTVQEVLDYVRVHGKDSETLNVIYVVDDEGQLIDDIRIREVLLAPIEKHVADLMDRRFITLTATDDQDAAVAVFRQHDRSALPVTDTAGMLIGIVTIDDVLDVAESAATREIQRIGGSEALDEPYMKIAFMRMIKKRAGWLTALFLGEMLTATAMGAFQAEITKAVVLALFVPLIISSGGNSGSQASTLVIRAMALGEVTLADWWRVMRREVMAGLTLGAILGAIGFLRITVWSAFSDIYGEHWLLVAITVAISLIGVVLWGTLSGSLLPFVLRRLGFDPAASSAPFVATLVDVTGLVIYFTVALLILHDTLLKAT
jgi:magnesium transporter